jgi:transcriptional regulator with XRE-family HTH domain
MVRIAVYNGLKKKRGISFLDFTALNELEYTKVPLGNFSLVGRYNNFKEKLVENRIYLINIKDEPSKPVKRYEILEKCKFVKYVNDDYLITYKRYRNQSFIDLYENRPEEIKEYLNWVFTRGKRNKRVHLNTFTKTIIEKILEKYDYENVVQYERGEKKGWNQEVADRVKSYNKKLSDKSTNWSKDEEQILLDEMAKDPSDRMPEKELSKLLGRTVPSIATKKWKLAHEYKSKLKDMKKNAQQIAKKLKDFRKEHDNMPQRQLVEESGVSLSVINQLECENYTSTTSATVKKLLDFIDNYDDNNEVMSEAEHAEEESNIRSMSDLYKARQKEKAQKESVDLGNINEGLFSRLDALTMQIGRLNENMEMLVKTQQDQLKKDRLFNELKELTQGLGTAV